MVFWEKSKSKKLTNKVATKKIKYVLLQLRACSRWRPLITKSMTLKSIESFIFADFNEKLPFYYNFYSRHITLYVVELTFVFTASKKFLKQKGTIECRFSEVFGRRYRKFSSNTYRFDVFNRRSMKSRCWIHAGLAFSNKASDTLPVNIHSKGINESWNMYLFEIMTTIIKKFSYTIKLTFCGFCPNKVPTEGDRALCYVVPLLFLTVGKSNYIKQNLVCPWLCNRTTASVSKLVGWNFACSLKWPRVRLLATKTRPPRPPRPLADLCYLGCRKVMEGSVFRGNSTQFEGWW